MKDLICNPCGKRVGNFQIPEDGIIRAYIMCPKCVEKETTEHKRRLFSLLNCYEIDGSEIHDGKAFIGSNEAEELVEKIIAII